MIKGGDFQSQCFKLFQPLLFQTSARGGNKSSGSTIQVLIFMGELFEGELFGGSMGRAYRGHILRAYTVIFLNFHY